MLSHAVNGSHLIGKENEGVERLILNKDNK